MEGSKCDTQVESEYLHIFKNEDFTKNCGVVYCGVLFAFSSKCQIRRI